MAAIWRIVVLLASILALTSGHSKQFQLLRNILTSSLDTMRQKQQVMRRDIMSDVQTRLVPHLRRALKEEMLEDLRKEIHSTLSGAHNNGQMKITGELKKEIHREVKGMVNGPLRTSLNEELVGNLRQEIQSEIRKGLANFLRKSLKDELSKDLRREMKQEVQSSMVGYLAESLRNDVIKKIEEGGPLKVQTKLTPYQRRILKQGIMKDVRQEIHAGFKNKKLQETLKDDILQAIKQDTGGAHSKETHRTLKETIMKDVRREVMRLQERNYGHQGLKEEILADVRREIKATHPSNWEESDSYKQMREYIERVTEMVEENSNKVQDLQSQDAISSLTKKVRKLERKLSTLESNLGDGLTPQHEEENLMIIPNRQNRNIILEENKGHRSIPWTTERPNNVPKTKETVSRRQVKRRKDPETQNIVPERTNTRSSLTRNVKEISLESVHKKIVNRNNLDMLKAPSKIIKVEKDSDEKENEKNSNIVISTMTKIRERYPNTDRLLVAKQNHSESYFVDVATGELSKLSSSLGSHVGDVAYDEIGRRIYWSDWRIDAIFSYSLLDEEQVMIKPNTLSYGIEVDKDRRVVVCSDYWSRTIFTMDIDMTADSSRPIHHIAKIDDGNPMRIALDAPSKRIYVTVSYRKILQINYETGRIRTIVEMQRSFINTLALNPQTKTLYFNSFTSVMSKRVNRRRKVPETVFHISGKEPSDILVHNGKVYVVYYNSADLDVVHQNTKDPYIFEELPFKSEHSRASMCFIPAH